MKLGIGSKQFPKWFHFKIPLYPPLQKGEELEEYDQRGKLFQPCSLLKLMIIIWIGLFPGISAANPNSYLTNPYWDSGKAEFQVYDAKIKKYGIDRNATVKTVIVKELFNKEKFVKTLQTGKSVEVIKMNYIRIIPAGIYDYYQMASLLFDRISGRVLKYTMSSQDGCGTTFMEYLSKGSGHRFVFHSYFDDQGDMEATIENEDFVFYDALPMVLRFGLGEQVEYTIRLVASLIANKKKSLAVQTAKVSELTVKNFHAGRKRYNRVFAVSVDRKGRKDVLYYETSFPHRLIKWEKGNGDILTLKKSGFLYYWHYTKPEHATLPE